MPKKIIIFSQSIFPRNSPRAHRATELAKEFSRKGHFVTVYSLSGGKDYSEFESQTNIRVKDLGKPYTFKYSHGAGVKINFFMKVLKKLAGRFFDIVELELMLKVFNRARREKESDIIITIAFPYAMHWGLALCRTMNYKHAKKPLWIADCGDPFMGNPFHKRAFYFKYVEKWFCRSADYLSIPTANAKEAYYPEFLDKIRVIPQGFRFEDGIDGSEFSKNPVPKFIYAGTFYSGIRDPRPLLNYLASRKIDFKFIIYTKASKLIEDYKNALGNRLVVKDYIERAELIREMRKCDFLVNFENPSQIQLPSKLIDYAISKRPILSINSSQPLDQSLVDSFLNGDYANSLDIEDLDQYNINSVAQQFLALDKSDN